MPIRTIWEVAVDQEDRADRWAVIMYVADSEAVLDRIKECTNNRWDISARQSIEEVEHKEVVEDVVQLITISIRVKTRIKVGTHRKIMVHVAAAAETRLKPHTTNRNHHKKRRFLS